MNAKNVLKYWCCSELARSEPPRAAAFMRHPSSKGTCLSSS